MTESVAKNWSYLYEKDEKTFDTPLVLQAEVVHGFKRGSKELGIPTANLNMDELGNTGNELNTGIYYGWAVLPNGTYPTVVSVGWNPFFKNEKKTVEAHLLQPLEDFYGEQIKLVLFGYLRQELNFSSLGEYLVIIQNSTVHCGYSDILHCCH